MLAVVFQINNARQNQLSLVLFNEILVIHCFRNSVPGTEIIQLIRGPITFFPCKCSHKEIWVPSNGIKLLKFFLVRDSGPYLLQWIIFLFSYICSEGKETKVILFSSYFFDPVTAQKPRTSNHL